VVRRRDLPVAVDPAGFSKVTYIGEGAAPPEYYRMDVIDLPCGAGVQGYTRQVEEAYFVHDGVLTVFWQEGGKTVEQHLGPRDLLLNPPGRARGFRNSGSTPVRFSMVVGEPSKESVLFQPYAY
jgi:mannose-6-phosphate isomerase-like protein (cupin superfamily)